MALTQSEVTLPSARELGALTHMLQQYRRGDEALLQEIFAQVYHHLRSIACMQKRKWNGADTINPTALVNEAYLKLVDRGQLSLESRAHFYALSARAMRQILVNYVELKAAVKRGGDRTHVSLAETSLGTDQNLDLIFDVERAVDKLRHIDPALADLVEMRFYAGMLESDIALVLGCTERTVRRNWSKAKALLLVLLND